MLCVENLKNLKFHTPSRRHFFSIICSKGKNKYGKIIKEKESIEIL